MAPLAQGGLGKLERVGDGGQALPWHDVTHGVGTAEDAGCLRLLSERVEGRQGVIGKVQREGAHTGGLHNKVLQK
jgi:hypothetical protein